MLKIFTLAAFLGIIPLCTIWAQNKIQRCATYESIQEWGSQRKEYQNMYKQKPLSENDEVPTTTTDIVIPIVVHVLHNQADGSIKGNNITEAQIISQIQSLNADYTATNFEINQIPAIFLPAFANEGTGIQFCLAKQDIQGNEFNGIHRVYTTKSDFSHTLNDCKNVSEGGADIWNPCHYLNIWVVPSLDNGQTLGYAQFPGVGDDNTDGVVIVHSVFGNESGTAQGGNYTKGRTLTHEVAHFFGLKHIWGDDNGACSGTDDISDTPNQGGATLSCPDELPSSCGSYNMTMNFLDYTYDECLYMFTKGQVARMQQVLNTHSKRQCLLNAAVATLCGNEAITPTENCQADYGILSAPAERKICFGGTNEAVQTFNYQNNGYSNLYLLAEQTGNKKIVALNETEGIFSFEDLPAGKYEIWVVNIRNNQKNTFINNIEIGTTTYNSLKNIATSQNLCFEIISTNAPVFEHLEPLTATAYWECLYNPNGQLSGLAQYHLKVQGGSGTTYTITGNNEGDILAMQQNYNSVITDNYGCTTAIEGILESCEAPTALVSVEAADFSLQYDAAQALIWVAAAQKFNYTLLDSYGRVLAQSNSPCSDFQVSLHAFAKGMYFLYVQNKQGSTVKKVVKW